MPDKLQMDLPFMPPLRFQPKPDAAPVKDMGVKAPGGPELPPGTKYDSLKPRTDLITWDGIDLVSDKAWVEARAFYEDNDCGRGVAEALSFLNDWANSEQDPFSLGMAFALTLSELHQNLTGGMSLRCGTAGTQPFVYSVGLLAIADVLAYGARKYTPRNWESGVVYSRYIAAAQRHLLAYLSGEVTDPESKLPHLAHAGCCIMFLLTFEARGRTDLDDRGQA